MTKLLALTSRDAKEIPELEISLYLCDDLRLDYDNDILCLEPFWTLYYIEFHGIALVERLIACCLNGGMMHEDIAASLPGNKSEALIGAKPLHRSLFFHLLFLCSRLMRIYGPLPFSQQSCHTATKQKRLRVAATEIQLVTKTVARTSTSY